MNRITKTLAVGVLAAVPATLFLAAPAPVVHAEGACTALAPDYDAYDECIFKMHVYCKYTGGFIGIHSNTCTYSDGGRDECVTHTNPYSFSGLGVIDHTCTYFPPGAEPAPAPGGAQEPAEPAPATAAEPVPSQS